MNTSSIYGTSLNRTLLRCRMYKDTTVKAELYTWSSEEFHHECALIYTSQSNPSHTCISYYRVNHNKVLFTLHDCLCEGNTVRIDLEILSERNHKGLFVLSGGKAEDSSGRFVQRIDEHGYDLFSYQDKFRHRVGQLVLRWGDKREVQEVQFSTGIDGDSFLTYFVRILCHPLKGFDVDISGPHCECADYFGRRPIGLCYVEYVSGMPAHDVVKHAHVKKISDFKAEKQDNKVGAPLASTRSNVVVNTGQTQGNFNSAYFKDCRIIVDAQAIQFKGFNST